MNENDFEDRVIPQELFALKAASRNIRIRCPGAWEREAAIEKGETEMAIEIEWVVTTADGSEVYIWAADEDGAFQESIERGYQPASAVLQT